MNRRYILKISALTVLAFSTIGLSHAQKSIILSSTTSTEQSGLFKHLLPAFENKTGIQVKVVAVGTGQALDIGRRGDADVVFVHDKVAEEKFVAFKWLFKKLPAVKLTLFPEAIKAAPMLQNFVIGKVLA